jgi:hypothetical protein
MVPSVLVTEPPASLQIAEKYSTMMEIVRDAGNFLKAFQMILP